MYVFKTAYAVVMCINFFFSSYVCMAEIKLVKKNPA